MVIRCVAIDDEPLALELMRNYINRHPALQLVQAFEDAITAAEFLRKTVVDLVFIDIQMPDISGLDLIRSLETKPLFVLTTAHKNYGFDGYELDVIDYLLKPIAYNRFSRSVQKAEELLASRNSQLESEAERGVLFVYSEYKLVKIDMSRIIFIEGLEDYIRIHLNNSTPVMTLMTLKKAIEKLPSKYFQRIHRSYIVGTRYINTISHRKLVLLNGRELPVGESFVDNIRQWFK